MSRSACRGLNRITSAPKRAKSNRLHAVAINSIPQQAVANGIGQTAERRAQLITRFSCVVRMMSVGSAASSPIVPLFAMESFGGREIVASELLIDQSQWR